MKKLFAEFFGTFWLVFAGTGAIIVNDLQGGKITPLGIALTFGLVVLILVYSLGSVSGAHFNPAFTFGFWIAKRLSVREVLPYILSQSTGAILASFLLHLLFPHHLTLGATFPTGGIFPSLILEFLMTSFLMFVILTVSTGAKEKGIIAGFAIGGT